MFDSKHQVPDITTLFPLSESGQWALRQPVNKPLAGNPVFHGAHGRVDKHPLYGKTPPFTA